ncbi:MAG: hypothetical protein QM796_03815 [Chthoniobacteraceae bacterium]
MTPFVPPPGYPRVKIVCSFQELLDAPFSEGVNAVCWPRVLEGDFAEVAAAIGEGEEITPLEEERLESLTVGAAGRKAIDLMLTDLRLLREHGFAPELNCIHAYPRDEEGGPVATDVFSYHADSAPVESETWLCTYHGPASEGLRNEEAQRRIDLPATRVELLREFGGKEDAAFREYLADQCYDLHYAPLPGAQPFSFGLYNLWRIAVDWPGSLVPPCIHRAPASDGPRLLLIS